MPLINTALRELTSAWNDHPVTTESNYTPRQMWPQGMLQQQQQALLPKEKLKITIIYNILIQTKVMFTQNN